MTQIVVGVRSKYHNTGIWTRFLNKYLLEPSTPLLGQVVGTEFIVISTADRQMIFARPISFSAECFDYGNFVKFEKKPLKDYA